MQLDARPSTGEFPAMGLADLARSGQATWACLFATGRDLDIFLPTSLYFSVVVNTHDRS